MSVCPHSESWSRWPFVYQYRDCVYFQGCGGYRTDVCGRLLVQRFRLQALRLRSGHGQPAAAGRLPLRPGLRGLRPHHRLLGAQAPCLPACQFSAPGVNDDRCVLTPKTKRKSH